MNSSIKKIEKLRQELNNLQPIEKEIESKLDKKFRLEFNFNSNHMEGNTLTYNETELLIIFDETQGNHTLREYEEMKAHDVALQLIKDWASDIERPLTEGSIKNLNEIILVKPFWKDAITSDGQSTRRLIKVGDYKEYPNSVQLSNGEIFEYASVMDTPILMRELIEWYRNEIEKNELHPVALAALLHYKFVRIHPFDDGNGRISRLLMNYVLFRNNLPPIVIKSSDKKNYLTALHKADSGDINSFINYIADQLIWSLELSIKAAKGENIDDTNDLEKEIDIWKKELFSKKITTQKKNNDLVYELYTKVIKGMFEQFEVRHQQFYDLFTNNSITTSVSNKSGNGIEWLTEEVERIFLQAKKSTEIMIPLNNIFKNISIVVDLKEYKYPKEHPISLKSLLAISLDQYGYSIGYINHIKLGTTQRIEKKYDEFLSIEEQDFIISECIKHIFNVIKAVSQ